VVKFKLHLTLLTPKAAEYLAGALVTAGYRVEPGWSDNTTVRVAKYSVLCVLLLSLDELPARPLERVKEDIIHILAEAKISYLSYVLRCGSDEVADPGWVFEPEPPDHPVTTSPMTSLDRVEKELG
jgi:hypothetical protein